VDGDELRIAGASAQAMNDQRSVTRSLGGVHGRCESRHKGGAAKRTIHESGRNVNGLTAARVYFTPWTTMRR
jgi:hypothetical protein